MALWQRASPVVADSTHWHQELRRRRRERRSKTRNIASTTTGSSSSAAAADDVSDELAYESEDDDADADDIARPLYIHLIRLHYLRSFSELASLEQELELLAHSIKMSEIPSGRGASASEGRGQGRARGGDDDGEGEGDRTWRLDRDAGGIGQVNAPLLDPQGRVSPRSQCDGPVITLTLTLTLILVLTLDDFNRSFDPSPSFLRHPPPPNRLYTPASDCNLKSSGPLTTFPP